jgi:hypothetical protein
MPTEPDANIHHLFDTWGEAIAAWMLLPEHVQDEITPPRQSHDCWIFDREQH